MGRKYVSSGGLISIPTMIRVFFLFEPFLQVTDSGGGTFCLGWRLKECWNNLRRWSRRCYSDLSAGADSWRGWW